MRAVTLEQLIALNREISALSSAGVPLSEGLVRVAEDFSGPTSELATRLSERLEQGQDLSAAINAEGEALPESYKTLVEAGLRSGRLTSALEGYTTTANRMAELRQVLGLASLYPLFLIISIWGLFLFLNNIVLPKFDWLGIDDRMWVQNLRYSVFSTGSYWRVFFWLLVPAVLVVLTWFWWRRSTSATEASVTGQPSWLGWIPGIARVRQLSCEANFADLLRLFIEQQVPLTDSLTLAASGSGLQAISPQTQDLVSYIEAGNTLGTKTPAFQNLPPLVRLALISHRGPENLALGLQRAVDSYHERAQDWANNLSLYLPITLTALIGGTCVAVYSLMLLQPYVAMLNEIISW